jgi:hypothetical protein
LLLVFAGWVNRLGWTAKASWAQQQRDDHSLVSATVVEPELATQRVLSAAVREGSTGAA